MKGRTAMNFFREPKSFIESLAEEEIVGAERRFFATALEIRRRLGKRAYLLDNYLSLLLSAIHVSSVGEAFEAGFDAYGTLLHATTQARNGEEDDFSQFELVKGLYNRYQAKYQEKYTACRLTHAAASMKILPDMAKAYAEEMEDMHRSVYDPPRLHDLYEEISHIVGDETMERLNDTVEHRFLYVKLLDGFFQGFTSQCLYSLLDRDIETNKQVFQLILDEMEQAEG